MDLDPLNPHCRDIRTWVDRVLLDRRERHVKSLDLSTESGLAALVEIVLCEAIRTSHINEGEPDFSDQISELAKQLSQFILANPSTWSGTASLNFARIIGGFLNEMYPFNHSRFEIASTETTKSSLERRVEADCDYSARTAKLNGLQWAWFTRLEEEIKPYLERASSLPEDRVKQ